MNKATYVTTVKAILKQTPNAFRSDVIQMVNKDDPIGVGEVYDELKRQSMAPKAKPAASDVFFQDTTPIHISKLMKHPENERLLPPLSSEERALLKEKMSQELEPQPFVVCYSGPTEDKYVVLDGNNRLDILLEMDFAHTVPCIKKDGLTLEEQRTYIEKCSLARRNLSKEAKAEIAKRQAARGLSQAEIAQNLGVSQQWVSQQTSEVKEARKEAEKESIVELKAAGMSNREVAEKIGISKTEVSRFTNFSNLGHTSDNPKSSQINDMCPPASITSNTSPSLVPCKESAIAHACEKLSEDSILKRAEIAQKATQAKPQQASQPEKRFIYILTESTDDGNHLVYIVVCAESSEEAENYNPMTNRFDLNEYGETNILNEWAQSSDSVLAQLIGTASHGVAKGDVAWRARGFNVQNV